MDCAKSNPMSAKCDAALFRNQHFLRSPPSFIGLQPQEIYQARDFVNQSVENAGVAFVKGADERNKFFEKINNQ